MSGSEARRLEPSQSPRQNFVSPFAADSARKGTPRQESSDFAAPSGPRIVAANSAPESVIEPVIMGSAVPQRDPVSEAVPDRGLNDDDSNRKDVARYVSAQATIHPAPDAMGATMQPADDAIGKGTSSTRAVSSVEERVLAPAAQPTPQPPSMPAPSPDLDRLQSAVLQALTDGNQRILVSMLSAGEWSVQGNELIIQIAESQTVVDMSLGPDAKRLAIASASGILGRPVKLKVVPGATVAPQEIKRTAGPSGPGGRGRAEQDPVVRRMQEKFGAQIRTVIDYKEKR